MRDFIIFLLWIGTAALTLRFMSFVGKANRYYDELSYRKFIGEYIYDKEFDEDDKCIEFKEGEEQTDG